MDATAKAADRARLAELRAELEEAEGFNDPAPGCAYLPDPRAPIAWNAAPGHRPPGLNTGAPGLNAHPANGGSARRRSRRARSRRTRVAAAVLIRLWIEGSQPLAGTAATEGSEPLRFDGWLELLRVVSELVTAAPSCDEDADAAG